jgi:hypothetical protein
VGSALTECCHASARRGELVERLHPLSGWDVPVWIRYRFSRFRTDQYFEYKCELISLLTYFESKTVPNQKRTQLRSEPTTDGLEAISFRRENRGDGGHGERRP